MTLNIDMDLDNAAFEADAAGEIARILRDLAQRVEDAGNYAPGVPHTDVLNCRDSNGNSVGKLEIE